MAFIGESIGAAGAVLLDKAQAYQIRKFDLGGYSAQIFRTDILTPVQEAKDGHVSLAEQHTKSTSFLRAPKSPLRRGRRKNVFGAFGPFCAAATCCLRAVDRSCNTVRGTLVDAKSCCSRLFVPWAPNRSVSQRQYVFFLGNLPLRLLGPTAGVEVPGCIVTGVDGEEIRCVRHIQHRDVTEVIAVPCGEERDSQRVLVVIWE